MIVPWASFVARVNEKAKVARVAGIREIRSREIVGPDA